mmetsp:Transcript_33525/g.51386  ORF Transcript_33525/g.51386 Transcript_33525/m.51386 type:complete len:112 (-) Transcript_33525:1173-1508(-)
MPPFLGQGANQAVQDAFSLASKIMAYNSKINNNNNNAQQDLEDVDLKEYLKQYERIRRPPTTSVTAKAAILGYIEVAPIDLVSKFRNGLFTFMGKTGLVNKILLGAALPRT